jgi:hypothetical protein
MPFPCQKKRSLSQAYFFTKRGKDTLEVSAGKKSGYIAPCIKTTLTKVQNEERKKLNVLQTVSQPSLEQNDGGEIKIKPTFMQLDCSLTTRYKTRRLLDARQIQRTNNAKAIIACLTDRSDGEQEQYLQDFRARIGKAKQKVERNSQEVAKIISQSTG